MTQRLLAPLLLLTMALQTLATVSVHPLFDDDMVLQRNYPVNIWGRGSAGESVNVTLGSKNVSTTVGSNGQWSVKLPAMPANKTPQILKVNTLEFKNVLVGDVWILNGQSNMRFNLDLGGDAQEYMKDLDIRLFKTNEAKSGVGEIPEDNFFNNGSGAHSWAPINPAENTTQEFSNIGLWFASKINRETDIPIGLILNAIGGTKIEAWTPIDALEASEKGQWIINYSRTTEGYKAQDRAGVLYTYITKAFTPLTIAGYFWYQGESNSDVEISDYYEWNMKLFIDEMRSRFVNAPPNMPFLIMQVHPWGSPTTNQKKYGSSSQAVVRDAQTQAHLAKDNTGLVVILDTGEKDIHSSDKKRPGLRAGTLALVRWYGKSIEGWRSPLFAGMSRLKDSVQISFDDQATGLKTTNGAAPTGFLVREKSTDFFSKADARIKGNQVVIWSSSVKTINEVRYAWDNFPGINLINQYGLPLNQFKATEFGPVATLRPTLHSVAKSSPFATTGRYDISGRRLQPTPTRPASGIYIQPTTGVGSIQLLLP
jgi:sialate O-acetylesterase